MVEHDLAKVGVASSSLVFRSRPLKRGFFLTLPILGRGKEWKNARMVELVDTQDLKSCGHCGRTGSSPVPGTRFPKALCNARGFLRIGPTPPFLFRAMLEAAQMRSSRQRPGVCSSRLIKLFSRKDHRCP